MNLGAFADLGTPLADEPAEIGDEIRIIVRRFTELGDSPTTVFAYQQRKVASAGRRLSGTFADGHGPFALGRVATDEPQGARLHFR